MADQQQKPKSSASMSDVWGIFQLLFFGLAILCGVAAVVSFLYEVWGLVTGNGWHFVQIGDVLDWLLGMPPPAENMGTGQKILAVSAILPVDFTMMAFAWLLSKISDGFEKLT
jgi:hypothetical protein